MTDPRQSADSIEPILRKLPTDSTEPADPMEPIDSTEPIEPMERTDPVERIDRTEPVDLTDQRERSELRGEDIPPIMPSPARIGHQRPSVQLLQEVGKVADPCH
jgi:hypothetical protein